MNDQGEPKMELTSLGEMWALESDQRELGGHRKWSKHSPVLQTQLVFIQILCDGSFGLLVLMGGNFEL